ncbi:hypothetical protein SBE55_00505 [Mycolicibacterium sp. 141076]|uniref:hypothetical protein n=1 Tax=Mycolicibacterium sp. 141076 TaxID=3090599 RepID=UPI00299DDF78|nr:hypothetical protein [Mycolicibacterium sp. 141076]MDX1876285.1 hypothetical protein [Mycolicibacterium sp. 141076]
MTEDLLRIVIDHPGDDTARLRFAQALPSGSPRRRFIILQLQMAWILSHEGNADDWDRYYSLRRHADVLLAENSEELSGYLRNRVRGVEHVVFARGFIERVTMTPAQFLAMADTLFSSAPILALRLSSLDGFDDLVQSPYLGRLRVLSVGEQRLGEDGMRRLVASPHVHGLRWLDVFGCDIGRGGVEELCMSSNLPELQWVALGANGFPLPHDCPASYDGDWIYDWCTDPYGSELEERFGYQRWLHFRTQHNLQWWPPDWQRFTGGSPAIPKAELDAAK